MPTLRWDMYLLVAFYMFTKYVFPSLIPSESNNLTRCKDSQLPGMLPHYCFLQTESNLVLPSPLKGLGLLQGVIHMFMFLHDSDNALEFWGAYISSFLSADYFIKGPNREKLLYF
jgi:hypothetical protein